MRQDEIIFAEVPLEKFDLLSREELIIFARGEQSLRIQMQKEVDRLRAHHEELKQKFFLMEDQLVVVKGKIFGKSSERSPAAEADDLTPKKKKAPKSRVQLPSERYPDATIIVRQVEFAALPNCNSCQREMKDSGMTEDSEFLTIIPQQYLIIRQQRHKYSCGSCHSCMKTAPAPPRITSGSSYSDEMAIDVSMAKYCDLIPVERYATIAKRAGIKDLPPQSLIELTHNLAVFAKPAYEMLKLEIQRSKVLHADETPHRMLEDATRQNWYLWGFSTLRACFFEIHGTRSGSVASSVLIDSNCEHLMSDVFSGYGKSVRDVNEARAGQSRIKIQNIYCNAHARRKFKEALDKFPDDAKFYMDSYREIYHLESEARGRQLDEIFALRSQMRKYFDAMKVRAMSDVAGFSSKSSIGKAMSYFLKNFDGFTLCLTNPELPIDNNSQERLLRSPVIGRKTWYGTHSERGAKTAAILFSLVESCKMNQVNPREYFKKLVQDLHFGKPAYTPSEFRDLPPKPPDPTG